MKNSDVRPEFLYKSHNVVRTSRLSCFCTRYVFIYLQKTEDWV